ncbi:MAG: RsbRD N-terminal domain-containing protein [Dehalococcoidia bacterium]
MASNRTKEMSQAISLQDTLARKRSAILRKWLGLIADTYPAGYKLFENKDRFTNPVGYTYSSEIETIYDELLQGNTKSEKVAHSLDRIIRITAVQEMNPSQAIGFIFLLKQAIRHELGRSASDTNVLQGLLEVNYKIDELVFTAFDMFASCRERIIELRVDQVKTDRDNAFRLMEKMLLKREELEDVFTSGYNNGSEDIE